MKHFVNLMERRSKAFSMTGGILSNIPWIRHIAPEASGYNIIMSLNKELKSFLKVRNEKHGRMNRKVIGK